MLFDQKENFKKYFSEYGEGFDLDDLVDKSDVFNLFKSIEDVFFQIHAELKNFYPNLPFVHLGHLTGKLVNASSTKINDKYFIAFNGGIFPFSFDLFSKILASRNTLPNIGDPSGELDHKQVLNTTKLGKDLIFSWNMDVSPPPIDEVRRKHVPYYMTLLGRFIIYHEFCHIIRGHVDYLKAQGKPLIWQDGLPKSLIEILGIDFCQTCEMDADSFATNWVFNAANNVLNNRYPFIDKDYQALLLNIDKAIFDYAFVAYCYFRILDILDDGFNKDLPHPPAIIRTYLIATNLVHKTSKELGAEKSKEISAVVVDAFIQGEKAISEVTHIAADFSKIKAFANPEIKKYMDSICLNWNQVRPKLEPFAMDPDKLPPYSK